MLGIPRAIPSMPCFPNMILPRLRETPEYVTQVYFHTGFWDGKGQIQALSSWDNTNVDRDTISSTTYDVWYEGVKSKLCNESVKKQKL